MCKKRFGGDVFVYGDNDNVVSLTDDGYGCWKSEQETLTNPLSDDYCKYENE